ncbi:hypothetical protein Tco_1442625, partial [Tanacetum coccineum]
TNHADIFTLVTGITSITVNGKNTYELKGKFLDDLHKNSFSGTNGEDAVEHIEYFLKIVDPIDLPIRWIYLLKGALWDYWKLGSDKIEPTNDETSDLEETDHDDEQDIGEIFRIETNLFDYETPLCEKFKEFNYLLKIDPDVLTKDIEGFKTYEEYKDGWIYKWNKDVPWVQEKPWTDTGDGYEIANHDHEEREYEYEHEDEERCELFDDHELPVCTIRIFEMIKYSFGQDEEYVAIKEDEYEDLTNTRKEAIHAYQEIFRMMDEGWMDLAERKEIDNVGGESMIWKSGSVGVLKPQEGCSTENLAQ